MNNEEKKWINDAFYVKKQRWGTWVSYDKDDKALITSLAEDICISATHFYLKGLQESFHETKTYDGEVGGKL
jgi:hypothetical protein